MENTIVIENKKNNKVFKSYDDMYNWWKDENSNLKNLSVDDIILLIHAVNFKILKSDFTQREIALHYLYGDYNYSEDDINEEDIEYEIKDNEIKPLTSKYHIVDLDGANLANIESELFDSIEDIFCRLEGTYLNDYFSEY